MAKVLMIAVSLRKDSFNKKLIVNAYRMMAADSGGHSVELLSFNDFVMPVFDGDIEAAGIPEGVKALAKKIAEADALIISTPEYNGGIPGPFKNAIDWVSRVKPMPWAGKKIFLMGTSPGALGAVRGLLHARQPLDVCGAYVYPEVLGIPKAGELFDADGKFKDASVEERVSKSLAKFRAWV